MAELLELDPPPPPNPLLLLLLLLLALLPEFMDEASSGTIDIMGSLTLWCLWNMFFKL